MDIYIQLFAPRHRAVQVTWLLCYSAPRRQAIGGQQTERSARQFSNSQSAAESVWCTLPPERRRHVVKNKDGMLAFFRCWRSVRLAKTSSFWRPRDVILDLILHPWSSFGQPFGALDAHLGPFWAPWRSRVPKLMIFGSPLGTSWGPFWAPLGHQNAKEVRKT